MTSTRRDINRSQCVPDREERLRVALVNNGIWAVQNTSGLDYEPPVGATALRSERRGSGRVISANSLAVGRPGKPVAVQRGCRDSSPTDRRYGGGRRRCLELFRGI